MHQVSDKLVLLQYIENGLPAIMIFGGWVFLHVGMIRFSAVSWADNKNSGN